MLLDEPLGLIVERLRRRGTDDASVEVKACTNKLSADVWEIVSAFANTAGGLIILGLNEAEGFVPSANFAIDRVRDQFVSGIGDGGSAAVVTHAPRYELDRGEVDGLQVLLVRIFELELKAKPCYIGARGVQNGSYKRVDDKDIKMSPAELYELQSALLPSDADGTVVSEATVEDLDPDVVRSIIANRRLQTPRVLRGADTLEKQLVRLNITTKDGAVKLAGLLSAGIYPQQFYPKLMIDVAVHSDVEKSAPGQPRFIDRQLCDGPIPACIEDALAAIGRNLRKAAIVQGAGRREDWEVPQEVFARGLGKCLHPSRIFAHVCGAGRECRYLSRQNRDQKPWRALGRKDGGQSCRRGIALSKPKAHEPNGGDAVRACRGGRCGKPGIWYPGYDSRDGVSFAWQAEIYR